MDDVIRKQTVLNMIDDVQFGNITNKLTMLHEAVRNLPPVDVRENVHGEWIDGKRIKMDGTYHWFRECSVCGRERDDANPDKDTDFCPNCGSDMRPWRKEDRWMR